MEKLFERIDALLVEKDRVILAIDGPCTAGKTTLAEKLAQHYHCPVLHMDDFFLRPEQRTPERFTQIGGNVDYERFYREVLVPLRAREPFSFRPFDCGTFALGDPVSVEPARLTVVEGTYSHHPYFGEPYDLKVMLTVDPQVQRARVLLRPAFLHRKFFEEWIPMENRYFTQWRIGEKTHILL